MLEQKKVWAIWDCLKWYLIKVKTDKVKTQFWKLSKTETQLLIEISQKSH